MSLRKVPRQARDKPRLSSRKSFIKNGQGAGFPARVLCGYIIVDQRPESRVEFGVGAVEGDELLAVNIDGAGGSFAGAGK